MHWEREGWVRAYRRNTADWLAVPWQARFVFGELLKAAEYAGPDRGLVRLGPKGLKGFAAAINMPAAEVEAGVVELLDDGCVVRHPGGLFVRNYEPAQDTPKSPSLRNREYRARKPSNETNRLTGETFGHQNETARDASETRRDAGETPRAQKEEEQKEEEKRTHPKPSRGEGLGALFDSLRALGPFDDATSMHSAVQSCLEGQGFACEREFEVPDRGDGRRGFVDLVARRGALVLAFELDRGSAREKSARKLAAVPDAVRVVLLREPGDTTEPDGIDRVLVVGAPAPVPGGSASVGSADAREADKAQAAAGPKAPPMADVRRVFETWQGLHASGRSKLDPKRERRIRARLTEGFTVEDLERALRGALHDTWLMGTRDDSTRAYRGVETLLRDAAQVERLIGLWQEREGGGAADTPEARASASRQAELVELADRLNAKRRERNAALGPNLPPPADATPRPLAAPSSPFPNRPRPPTLLEYAEAQAAQWRSLEAAQ